MVIDTIFLEKEKATEKKVVHFEIGDIGTYGHLYSGLMSAFLLFFW